MTTTDPSDQTGEATAGAALASPVPADPEAAAARPEAATADPPAADAAEPVDDEPLTDLEDRVLCPDGACIGVIGPDGRCKVCGQAAEPAASAPAPSLQTSSAAADGEEEEAEPDDDSPPDFAGRRLCSDGACIGVIGPDHRCKECGKPYSGDPEL